MLDVKVEYSILVFYSLGKYLQVLLCKYRPTTCSEIIRAEVCMTALGPGPGTVNFRMNQLKE